MFRRQPSKAKVGLGGGKVSYLQVQIKIVSDATMEYRIVGPSDTKPDPALGYTIDPESIEISGIAGKFWVEYKIITP